MKATPQTDEGLRMNVREERGFVLPLVIFGMLIAAVIIAGATFVGRQELRIGIASSNGVEAFYLAERGLTNTMTDWSSEAFSLIPLGSDTTLTDTLETGMVATTVTRVGDRLYLLEATSGLSTGGAVLSGASRSVGLVVRLFDPQLDPPAALTTRGTTVVKGNAEVHGEDVDPTGWGGFCGFPNEDKPGILTDNAGGVSTVGQGTLSGTPAVQEDTTIADSTFTQFGEMSWSDLTAIADLTLPGGNFNGTGPVVASGRCVESDLTNWGDPENPTDPCGDYFPIIHVTGDARMQSAGVGQGVLLVDGDLDLRGGFVFHGIIIVQGTFESQGSGNKVFGGVFAGNATLENQALTGGSVIQQSTCAVERTLLNISATRPRPLGIRSWVDLSATAR
jgi:hypothetical protein